MIKICMEKYKDLKKIINNFRSYDQDQPYWDTIYISKLLPMDHPAIIISHIIERLNLDELYNCYSHEGNPSYHPKMMLKVLFYGYYCGVMSCRKLWEAVMYRADFIFLAAGNVPNFRTINDFRLRHLKHLPGLFSQIVLLCIILGMIGFENLTIDGQLIQANASYKMNKDKEGLKKEYEKTKEGMKKLLEKEPSEDFPQELKDKRIKKVAQKLYKIEEMQKQLESFIAEEKKEENNNERKDGGKRRREKDINKVKLNMTDSDAKQLRQKDNRSLPSYNHQSATDGKLGVVCAAQTTQRPDNPDDLFPLIDMVELNTGTIFKNVLADCAFGSYENYEKMEQREEDYFVPDEIHTGMKRGKFQRNGYAREFFIKTVDGNYLCPEGQLMEFTSRVKRKDHEVDIYKGKMCSTCDKRELCTNGNIRTLQIDTRCKLQDEMREKLETDRGREIYKKRKWIAEPNHGDDQKNRGWKQHHLRSLLKATGEFLLIKIGTNLRKIVKYRRMEVLGLT